MSKHTAKSVSPSTTPAPLRTALIGLGRIGFGYHAPAILKHPGLTLAGVADPLPERRAEASRCWHVPSFESAEDLLSETRPDLVVVASPTAFHQEHACLAFAHGAHVLCDKPVARSLSEFDVMLGAAAEAKRRFLAYHPYRVRSELLTLRVLLARNLIGPIHAIKRANCSFVRRDDWQAFRANGGGLLNNYGSHHLDEIIALLGTESSVRTVFCHTRCVVTAGDAEDFVKIVLVTENGLLVDLHISQACAQAESPWQVFGAHGAATWDPAAGLWRARYYNPAEAPALRPQQGLAAANRMYAHEELPWREAAVTADSAPAVDYYELVWRHLVRNEAPPVTCDEVRQLLTLIERCRNSASTGSQA